MDSPLEQLHLTPVQYNPVMFVQYYVDTSIPPVVGSPSSPIDPPNAYVLNIQPTNETCGGASQPIVRKYTLISPQEYVSMQLCYTTISFSFQLNANPITFTINSFPTDQLGSAVINLIPENDDIYTFGITIPVNVVIITTPSDEKIVASLLVDAQISFLDHDSGVALNARTVISTIQAGDPLVVEVLPQNVPVFATNALNYSIAPIKTVFIPYVSKNTNDSVIEYAAQNYALTYLWV